MTTNLLNHPAWAITPQGLQHFLAQLRPAQLREAISGRDSRAPSMLTVSDGLGVIRLTGALLKDAPAWWDFATSMRSVGRALTMARADDKVAAVVLVIDSPGGSVDGLAELGDAIAKVRESKPVIAQVDGMAASAGYYIAAATDRIFAGRMDMVGSIGTILPLYDFSKAFEKAGVEAVPIDTDQYKHAGMMGTKLTKAQRADFQRIVDAYYLDFLVVAARGRHMPPEKITDLGARVFVGEEAKRAGLVDALQTFNETFAQFAIRKKPGQRTTPRIDSGVIRTRLMCQRVNELVSA